MLIRPHSALADSLYLTLFLLLSSVFLLSPASASDDPFTGPANWGGTGLMEIPTARVMKENTLRAGAGQTRPYRYFYGAVSPLRGLEIDGRITEILGIPSGLQDQKNFKDKAIDIKYQFLPEGKYMPALALGIMDPHGTRVYPSQYIAASKQIFPFDFTIGFGNGRFGKRPLLATSRDFRLEILTHTGSWIDDSQLFWGVQFAPSEQISLMAEYSPVQFHRQTRDPAQGKYFKTPVSSEYNFGIRYMPFKWAEIDVTYQRGEEVGINLSIPIDIGRPLIPIYNKPYRENRSMAVSPLNARLTEALHHSGFSDIFVQQDNTVLLIQADNDKYFYNMKAIGVIVRLLSEISPEGIKDVHIMLARNGITLVEFSSSMEDIVALYKEELSPWEFHQLSTVTADTDSPYRQGKYRRALTYGFKPSIETFLNDPSGFFKYRAGLSGWARYRPRAGTSLIAGLSGYPLNNISTSNESLSIPVRSDIAEYKGENLALSMLMAEQIHKFPWQIAGRLAAGLLEIEYAGIDAELAAPVFGGRVVLGVSGSAVKKRDPGNPFRLKQDPVKDIFTTAFLNARLNVPEAEMTFDIKAGRFLAGDNGARLTITKEIRGVKLWVWYSITDTSVFSDDINDGYHDKGIGISIPMRLFAGTDSRTSYSYALAPWTRDTGQDIMHTDSLFDYIGRNIKIFLDKDSKIMYK